jgi:hypothetical protein
MSAMARGLAGGSLSLLPGDDCGLMPANSQEQEGSVLYQGELLTG